MANLERNDSSACIFRIKSYVRERENPGQLCPRMETLVSFYLAKITKINFIFKLGLIGICNFFS